MTHPQRRSVEDYSIVDIEIRVDCSIGNDIIRVILSSNVVVISNCNIDLVASISHSRDSINQTSLQLVSESFECSIRSITVKGRLQRVRRSLICNNVSTGRLFEVSNGLCMGVPNSITYDL